MSWSIIAGVAVGLVTVVVLFVVNDANREPVHMVVPKKKQTYVLPGEERVHRMNRKDWVGDGLISLPESGVTTLYENFSRAIALDPKADCLGHYDEAKKGYVWESYGEVCDRLQNFGSGLMHLGNKVKSKVGIMAKNIPEWVIAEQACNAFNLVLVPLYDTLGPEAMTFIVGQVKLTTVIGDADAIHDLLESAKSVGIEIVIKVGEPTEKERSKADADGIKLYSVLEVEEMGKEYPREHIPPEVGDLATIQYTSGTTGNPKGVMLSHE